MHPFIQGFMKAADEGLEKEGFSKLLKVPKIISAGKAVAGMAGARVPSISAKGVKAGVKVLKPKVTSPTGGLISSVRRSTSMATGLNPKSGAAAMGMMPKPKVL